MAAFPEPAPPAAALRELYADWAEIMANTPGLTTRLFRSIFDEWHQPLSANQVGDVKGKVSAIVNGKLWTKDPREIPLNAHNVIQLNVGSPVPFATVNWGGTGL